MSEKKIKKSEKKTDLNMDKTNQKKTWKNSKYFMGILILAVALIFLIWWYFGYKFYQIQNLKIVNKQFFSYIKENNNFQARNTTAMVFKQKVDLNAFDNFVRDNSLYSLNINDLNYGFIKWFKWKLSGNFWNSNIEILFLDEAGKWKIYEILLWSWIKLPADFEYTPPKVSELNTWNTIGSWRTSIRPKELDNREEENRLPTIDEAKILISTTMSGFVDAINKKDFQEFYLNSAELFKGQTDAKAIQSGFQKFIDQNIDLNYIKSLQPQLSGNIIKDNYWFLILNWKYSTAEKQDINFILKYNKENSLWKLVSITVSIN